jgi:iron-sulfur cluster repair protein YtfE (RIC family)
VTFDLQERAGWPPELRVLVERFPREAWQGHGNLGAVAQFWLDRHAEFRALGKMLAEATEDFRKATLTPDEFRRFFAPRLQFFLQGLEGHHQIEDFQYFPIFRRAEPRLAKGFDVLEGDHEAIHADILRVVDAANELLGTIEGDADRRRVAKDAYAHTSERLLKGLIRHLDDEEDLIVPVILDQGERKLFYG